MGAHCPAAAWAYVRRGILDGAVTVNATATASLPFARFLTSDQTVFTTGTGLNPTPAPGDTLLQVLKPGATLARMHVAWEAGAFPRAASINAGVGGTFAFANAYWNPADDTALPAAPVAGLQANMMDVRLLICDTSYGMTVVAQNGDALAHNVNAMELWLAFWPAGPTYATVY